MTVRVGDSPRIVFAALVFALATSVSYVAQRLATHLSGDLPPSAILAQAHVPFFWRATLSLWHGFALGLLVLLLVPDLRARQAVGPTTRALPWFAATAAALTVLVP